MRSHSKTTAQAVRETIRNRQMQPALDALNALQSTAWTINRRVLDVLRACFENNIPVKGLPPMADLPLPEIPDDWDSMERASRREVQAVLAANRIERKTGAGTRHPSLLTGLLFDDKGDRSDADLCD